ncbi:hypothetical protein [Apis mellifera associated microvirus 48]|nr:hypothetical protein [Apis mellifera associated microvirus 48]
MSRKSRKGSSGRDQPRLARQSSPALGHTASRYTGQPLSDYYPASLADIREAFSLPTVRPLIRTVLPEPDTGFQAPPRRGKRSSPAVAVRATMRSSDRVTRSPYLNATMFTPDLTARAILCAKRSIRREVIFATKSAGRGAKAPRRKRSKVKC